MNDIAKLPKWAQEHITSLQRERDAAVRALNEFQDNQTVSKIWHDEIVCDGDNKTGGPSFRRHYINGAHHVTFEHAGVNLDVHLTKHGKDDVIDLRWEGTNFGWHDVTMQPMSFQSVRLFRLKQSNPDSPACLAGASALEALTKIANPGEGGRPGPDLHECIQIAKAALQRSNTGVKP